MNVIDRLESGSAAPAGRAALIEGIGDARREITYAELGRWVDRVTGRLRASGLDPGARVLLAMPFSIDMTIVLLAVLKAGMVATFVDPGHGPGQVGRCLRRQPPEAVVAAPWLLAAGSLLPEIRRIPRKFRVRGSRGLLDGRAPVVPQAAEPRSPEDSALLTFTSGNTGEPKPVVRTHGFLLRQMAMIDKVAAVRPGDVDFVAMPMFVLFNLGKHVTSLVPACDIRRPGRADPSVAFAQLRAEHATRIVASPALLDRLARYGEVRRRQLPALRRISTGGGPVPPNLPDRLQFVAPRAHVVSVYGSTEAEPIAAIDHSDVGLSDLARMRDGGGLLVGRPVEGCTLRILRHPPPAGPGPLSGDDLHALSAGAGEIGEIAVAGPHVLECYADGERPVESKFEVEGRRWHRTGDAGYVDERGRLWLTGRVGAAIRDARGTVYPFQVEMAAESAAGVRRAALVAVAGLRVLAIERRRGSLDCARLARCVTEQSIDRVVMLRRIPVDRRHNAKVDYAALRRRLDGPQSRVLERFVELLGSAVGAALRLVRRVRLRCRAARVAQASSSSSSSTPS